ncbi:MAG: DUF2167 domain-containing protein [Anaerolineales bacterium]|nr:DUF2167 domain-containing protein [Anaerolineales bacterium]
MMTMILSSMALSHSACAERGWGRERLRRRAHRGGGAAPPARRLVAFFWSRARPQSRPTESADATLSQLALEASFTYRQGDIPYNSRRPSTSPATFRYLAPPTLTSCSSPGETPPGGGGEGLLVPARPAPFASEGWAILTYTEDGHVEDDDAAEIDYDEPLRRCVRRSPKP